MFILILSSYSALKTTQLLSESETLRIAESLPPLSSGMGIHKTFIHSKNNGLQQRQAPSPAEEGWGEENKIN
jgi:hypothetical protein